MTWITPLLATHVGGDDGGGAAAAVGDGGGADGEGRRR